MPSSTQTQGRRNVNWSKLLYRIARTHSSLSRPALLVLLHSLTSGKRLQTLDVHFLSQVLEVRDILLIPKDVRKRLVSALCMIWVDGDRRSQRACMQLLRVLCQISEMKRMDVDLESSVLLDVLVGGLSSGDAVVRRNALHGLAHLVIAGIRPSLDIQTALHCLRDDSSDVRLGAMHLVWALRASSLDLQATTRRGSTDQARLTREVFLSFCMMINDNCPVVRSKTCTYLGTSDRIDTLLLLQTLSKELMEVFDQGGFGRPSSGKTSSKSNQKKSAAKGLAGSTLAMDVTLSGAFVLGVEDQFAAVRNSAVDAVSDLVLVSTPFAQKSLEFLVDILNDETESVRLNAINSLRRMAHIQATTMDDSQIESMSLILRDADQTIRHAAHRLLGAVRVSSIETLRLVLSLLDQNLGRFPEDKLSLFQCAQEIGRGSAEMIDSLIAQLLNLDHRFLPKEVPLEDDTYMGHLIVVFSAYSTGMAKRKLPKTVLQQLPYLRAKFPLLAPHLQVPQSAPPEEKMREDNTLQSTLQSQLDSHAPLSDITTKLHTVLDTVTHFEAEGKSQIAQRLLTNFLRDLECLCKSETIDSGVVRFARDYVNCCISVLKIKESISIPHRRASIMELASRLLELTYRMQCMYVGLSRGCKGVLEILGVFARICWVVMRMTGWEDVEFRVDEFVKVLREQMAGLHRVMSMQDHVACDGLFQSIKGLQKVSSTQLLQHLLGIIQKFPLFRITVPVALRRCRAKFESPAEIPIGRGGLCRVDVEARIWNAVDTSLWGVEVILPSGTTLFRPLASEYRPCGPYRFRLRTSITVRVRDASEGG
ncbi:uncharacterized protein SPPG_04373 [Spizellomyces punctatus DAOM BR117]|uniref:INTS4 8 helical bundle domain-containing protein n=1 Tax=Spizellomyces punctatus (strain DAOM BR117) TaxID=645134 RepID=A0A0L0HG66_SPIPD|nr:uncharacterized protein SPPG_04373 [Spizellomyces punctatus DAOM BR117]KND00027.1 hypothetical protein SPPG_04373 [Spizellomyces punctatus DAOM BR117]|eukprot:XP_016608066.1 hypothetical protein SPPG_04373 [Spizellomyces punctatus DAOM BR117]